MYYVFVSMTILGYLWGSLVVAGFCDGVIKAKGFSKYWIPAVMLITLV